MTLPEPAPGTGLAAIPPPPGARGDGASAPTEQAMTPSPSSPPSSSGTSSSDTSSSVPTPVAEAAAEAEAAAVGVPFLPTLPPRADSAPPPPPGAVGVPPVSERIDLPAGTSRAPGTPPDDPRTEPGVPAAPLPSIDGFVERPAPVEPLFSGEEDADAGRPGSPLGPPADPRGLLPMVPLRYGYVLSSLIATAAFASVLTGVVAWAFTFLIVVGWSGLAAENARRARPDGPHVRAPHAGAAVTRWLLPFLVLLVGGVLLDTVRAWSDDQPHTDRELVVALVWVVTAIAFVVTLYAPYGYLVKVARWIGSNPDQPKRWFWAPIWVALVGGLAWHWTLSEALPGMLPPDWREEARLFLGLFFTAGLPAIVHVILGNRTMEHIEAAARHTWHRRMLGDVDTAVFEDNPTVGELAGRPLPVAMHGPMGNVVRQH